ncbi:serine/threonine-protein kinase [Nonomuraea sp. ATR24]|uniref:serine/threonine-protein kinase n=1 Tax=Nonomuraea TaxID=83681 RepID=UPI001C5FCC9B|nr:serine/threonine-protein kinase [Nonomuraea ceibae]
MTRHEPGDILARRYLLLDPLATGGMSVIWRAFDQSLQRVVAVKVLTSSLQTGLVDRMRARSEARAAARFIHPDAIEIYDYGEAVTANGEVAAYVVMPLLDGTPLAERVAGGPLPWPRAAAIGVRLARVLAAGHARGLVHRDVTGENVLLTADGPKLLDFGIAAWAGDPDDDRGTPPYVAPERLDGAPTHPAVDVYALGVLLFTMITGRTPYPETTWEEIEAARRTSPAPRPAGAPHAVATLCQRCLDPDPARRPTADEVATALAAALTLPRRLRKGLAVVGAAAVMSVAASLAMSVLVWFQPPAERAGPEAGPSPTAAASFPESELFTRSEPIPQAEPFPGSESPPVEARTMRQAVDGFHSALETAVCGATDGDVALDLKQVLRGVLVTPGQEETGLASLRRKLTDREREGRLTPGCRSALEVSLNEITAARRAP